MAIIIFQWPFLKPTYLLICEIARSEAWDFSNLLLETRTIPPMTQIRVWLWSFKHHVKQLFL